MTIPEAYPLWVAGEAAPRAENPIPEAVRRGPRVRIPARDYLLYEGAVEPVTTPPSFARREEQTVNLWWSADRAWAVASEIDLRWSYVGGSADLIDAVLTDSRIEALPTGTGEPLSRVEDWVARWVEEAVDQLLATGRAIVWTSRGTVEAELQRPTWLRHGWSRTSSMGDNGVVGDSNGRIERDPDTQLRRHLTFHMTIAVIGLVGA